MHLDKDCITPVLDAYGYKRTAWVLANTLHELKWDGRFSYANKHWAEKIYIPTDLIHNSDFVVRSHPAVLDGFVSLYRKARRQRQMCIRDSVKSLRCGALRR